MRWVLKVFTLSMLLVFSAAAPGAAGEWAIVGARALGMGGAGVAVANAATASYWNPAAFGFFTDDDSGDYYGDRLWSVDLSGGLGVQIHEDLGGFLNDILDIDYDNLDNGEISADKVADFLLLVDKLEEFAANENRAATVLANAALAVQVGHFGVGVYEFIDVSGKGDLDLVNIAPVTQGLVGEDLITEFSTTSNFNNGTPVPAGDYFFDSSTKNDLVTAVAALSGWDTTTATDFVQAVDYGLDQADLSGVDIPANIVDIIGDVAGLASDSATGGSFSDNESGLLFRGIAITEIPITYGYAFSERFAVGGNLKLMKARVYNTLVPVFDTDFEDALDAATKTYKDSSTFGVDLGVLFKATDMVRLGLVARNLNSPKFDMDPILPSRDDEIKQRPQVRAGIAISPIDYITLALDVDLTDNDTTVSSRYKAQNVAGGVEVSLLNIMRLRAGAYKNIAESDIGMVYTAGIGFQTLMFSLDLAAAVSSDSTDIDGNDIWNEARLAMEMALKF